MSADLCELDSLRLIALCASDTQSAAHWSEFVRRFGPKLRLFIRGTLWQSAGGAGAQASLFVGGVQENDLFQNTIIRLVENDCAALKRFSGKSEADFLAYLAVISRSVVRDYMRRHCAKKRPLALIPSPHGDVHEKTTPAGLQQVEKSVLAREIVGLSRRTIHSLSGESSERDWLIFQLYYYDGLSTHQIAQCKTIDLSKAGVEKVLHRLKERVRSLVSVDRSEAAIQ